MSLPMVRKVLLISVFCGVTSQIKCVSVTSLQSLLLFLKKRVCSTNFPAISLCQTSKFISRRCAPCLPILFAYHQSWCFNNWPVCKCHGSGCLWGYFWWVHWLRLCHFFEYLFLHPWSWQHDPWFCLHGRSIIHQLLLRFVSPHVAGHLTQQPTLVVTWQSALVAVIQQFLLELEVKLSPLEVTSSLVPQPLKVVLALDCVVNSLGCRDPHGKLLLVVPCLKRELVLAWPLHQAHWVGSFAWVLSSFKLLLQCNNHHNSCTTLTFASAGVTMGWISYLCWKKTVSQ